MRTFENSFPENPPEKSSILWEVLSDARDFEDVRHYSKRWLNNDIRSLRKVERLIKKLGTSLADKTRTFFRPDSLRKNPLIFRLLKFSPEWKSGREF